MSGKEIELTPEAARVLMALYTRPGMDYLNEKRLARQLKMSAPDPRRRHQPGHLAACSRSV